VTGTQDKDWPAVGIAIRDRMRELETTTAQLARETGLSQTTIRYIGQPGSRKNKASLVAIAGVLRCRYDHLTNILHGHPRLVGICRAASRGRGRVPPACRRRGDLVAAFSAGGPAPENPAH
jgi:hypothetical protein